jgi:hypothetical protein
MTVGAALALELDVEALLRVASLAVQLDRVRLLLREDGAEALAETDAEAPVQGDTAQAMVAGPLRPDNPGNQHLMKTTIPIMVS